jgi:hypothetical protein
MPLPKLTLPPDQAQYAAKQYPTSVSTKLDGGASRFRADELGAAFLLDVQWTMSAANFLYLNAFYRTAVNNGADPFQIDLLIDDGIMRTYTAHFLPGTYGLIQQEGETFTVSAQIEVIPDPTYSAGDAALLGIVAPPPSPTGGGVGTVITPPSPPPNSISAFSITANVVTATGVFPTPYATGAALLIAGTGTFLDGAVLTALAGASGTTFTANYTHANMSTSGLTGSATLQPPALPTLDDVLDWMLLLTRTTQHVSGSGVNAYHWKDADNQKIWLIKSPSAWAADINVYDNAHIYHYITENGDLNNPGHIGTSYWSDPHAFKRHFPLMPILPRHFDVNGPPVTVVAAGKNPVVRTILDETDGQPIINLGPVTNVLHPQALMAWGGSVGTVMTIVNRFYYGNQREEFFYVKNVGLVQWTHAVLTSGPKITGVYTLDQPAKLHNNIVAGGCPTPIFPAYNVIPGTGFGGGWIGGNPGAGANIP